MNGGSTSAPAPQLAGQTVVLIGGSAGIGLETARRARLEGADVILTGRNPERLKAAAADVGALRTAAFDANDSDAFREFFDSMPAPIDHILITAGGPTYGPMLEMDVADVRDALSGHVVLGLQIARVAQPKMRPGGSLLLMGGTGGRRIDHRVGIVSAATATLPPFTAALALEIAPVRVQSHRCGLRRHPRSLRRYSAINSNNRRQELISTLPIGRVVTADDVAALAIHLMVNTALTGATYDIDGGQQFV